MSYPQFGYTYSPTAVSCTLASSQLLVPGSASALPSTTTAGCGGGGAGAGGGGGAGGVTDPSRSLAPTVPSDPSSPGGSQGTGVYSPSLLSYPRGLTDSVGVYGSYAAQGYMPFGGDPSAFYSPLGTENTDAWRNLSQPAWPYDPTGMAGYPYGTSYGGLDVRRKNATRESTSTLKAWLYEHIKNPYPTKGEKIMLAIITKMTLTQVSTWFANARRRLKKENKMQWSPRNRTGEDDDDEKEGSDCDDGEDGGKPGGGGKIHHHQDRKDDDEDINIVDAGNEQDSLLSGPDDMNVKRADHLLSDLAGLGPSSADHHHFSHLHPHLPAPSSPGQDANGNKLEDKPRIWSLADVATSSSPPLGRRSPTCPITNHAPIGGPGKTTAFSPPSHHSSGGGGGGGGGGSGFHPWLNGGGAVSIAGGTGYISNHSNNSGLGANTGTTGSTGLTSSLAGSLGGYSSPFTTHHVTPVATPMGGLTTRPPGMGSLHGPGVIHTPGYDKITNNGILGDKPSDSPHLSSYSQQPTSGAAAADDTGTAFKPVPKRL